MKWPFGRRAGPEAAEAAALPGESDLEHLTRLAHAHLSGPDAERWLALLRPAVRLTPAGGDAAIVARLGGEPDLPTSTSWPAWPGVGPLSYIGELRCAELAAFTLDIALPKEGRLLFFYFDGSYDHGLHTVGTWDAETLQGARVVHVGDDEESARRTTPDGLVRYPERAFAGQAIMTAPGWEHPDLEDAFMEPGEDRSAFASDHPVNADAFIDAVSERHRSPLHQVGGYAEPVQGPVEHEVAHGVLGSAVRYDDPRMDEEARRWELLFQVDSDDDLQMMWGDAGMLYWLARPDDLSRGDLSQVSFTWQCY